MSKLIKVGDEYHMINDDDTTINVKESVSFLALALFEDVVELRKNEADAEKRMPQEIMPLNALCNAEKTLNGRG